MAFSTSRPDLLAAGYQRAMDLASEAILIAAADGRVIFANPAFLNLTGYSSDAMAQGMVTPWLEGSAQMATMWSQLARGACWSGRVRLRCADGGTLEFEASVAPLMIDTHVAGYVQVLRDLSQESRLEAQLLHAQKMEAVGRLAGGVAHDFNNLLTVINGHAEMMLHRLNRPDKIEADLRQIRKAGDSAASLTRQLLAFSRRQRLQPRLVDPGQLMNEMQKMLRRLIDERITLELNVHESASVYADPGQIEQVVMNLVVNARDAMPNGGKVTISVRNEDWLEPSSRGGTLIPAGAWSVLTVRDTGVGIAPEIQHRIFEPFFTTKEAGKGTGLGLSTVHGIVHQSGGFLVVDSVVGEGSAFEVFLPRVVTPRDEEPVDYPRVPVKPHHGERILIVEDDVMVRTLLHDMLGLHGYEVVVAEHGAQAVEICGAPDARIDLLLTDIIMPQMNGFQLARQLLALRPQLRIVFMSGYTDEVVNECGIPEGEIHFLQKPFSTQVLERKLREVLDAPHTGQPG